jgi:hypothetical protein
MNMDFIETGASETDRAEISTRHSLWRLPNRLSLAGKREMPLAAQTGSANCYDRNGRRARQSSTDGASPSLDRLSIDDVRLASLNDGRAGSPALDDGRNVASLDRRCEVRAAPRPAVGPHLRDAGTRGTRCPFGSDALGSIPVAVQPARQRCAMVGVAGTACPAVLRGCHRASRIQSVRQRFARATKTRLDFDGRDGCRTANSTAAVWVNRRSRATCGVRVIDLLDPN